MIFAHRAFCFEARGAGAEAKAHIKTPKQVQGFRPLRVRVPFGWTQKEPKGPFAGREPTHEAASVPSAPRLTRHAAQTRCAQTWAALRPRQAPVLGSLYGSISDQELEAKAKGKGKGKGKAEETARPRPGTRQRKSTTA
ncbi:MAG: hypothetical protein ACJ8GV_14755 [Luteimonas sp.]